MKRIALLSIAAMAALTAACSTDAATATTDTTPAAQPTATPTKAWWETTPPAATTAASETPVFWMRTDRTLKKSPGGYVTVLVPTTPDPAGINAIVKDVRAMKASEQGGWFVQIRCGQSIDDPGGTVIANAKFAFDNLGAAQTGLTKYGQDVDINPNASCG